VQYFPDFVFYLQPDLPGDEFANGALVNLRSDGESALSQEQKANIFEKVYTLYPNTEMKDVHKLPFDITPDIREQYINGLFAQYQSRELIVTDMMHGMIFAVINHIPCVALDDAIPHKLSGYKSLLSRSVAFADSVEDVGYLAEDIVKDYAVTDLSIYFKEFECLIALV
jgi:pyruvyl transferase EpsI